MNNTDKAAFRKQFESLYKGKRLLALQLNGFSHTIFYDDGHGSNKIYVLRYSGCAPEQNTDDKVKQLLSQFPHSPYQGNPVEVVWVQPGRR